MTVVVLGDVMADVVARHRVPLAHGSDTAADVMLQGGGAAANVAAWLAHAGVAAALVACVGDDFLADVALGGLDRVDLRVRRVAGARTGTCVVLVGPDGERTMLPDAGANLHLAAEDVARVPAGSTRTRAGREILHVSGYALLRPQTRALARMALDQARACGMLTSLDPASAAPLAAMPGFLAAAGPVDLLLPNAAEAAVLGDAVWERAREVVVTRGAGGASWSDGRRTLGVPAARVDVVDTTGAGDAFTAGFLSAWPGDPETALRRGAALAAEAVGRAGARPSG